MFLIIKLFLVAAALMRQLRCRAGHGRNELDGIAMRAIRRKGKRRGQFNALEFGVQLRSRASLLLTRENAFDHLTKRLGLTEEIQTGDSDFDSRVFVGTDQIPLRDLFTRSADARRLVLDLFAEGMISLECEGNFLFVKVEKDNDSDAKKSPHF